MPGKSAKSRPCSQMIVVSRLANVKKLSAPIRQFYDIDKVTPLEMFPFQFKLKSVNNPLFLNALGGNA